ncbi:MAG: HEAT repeat domain-containing protein [Gammaproteobacteria bacterium]|nr:HEAT repeat domain-containing protein [Gammaproteobacteria bacterium]
MAVIALGNLKEYKIWHDLVRMLNSDNATLALASFKALMSIGALLQFKERYLFHSEWPVAYFIGILDETAKKETCEILSKMPFPDDQEQLIRMMQYIAELKCANTFGRIDELIDSHPDPKVLTLALQTIDDNQGRGVALKLSQHDYWHVRSQAVSALGRIGDVRDAALLANKMSDPAWWVRYRAAQALFRISKQHQRDIEQVVAHAQDPFAIDIWHQVIKEQKP